MASSLASDSLLFECTEENCKSILHYKCFSVLVIQSNLEILTSGVWIQCSTAFFTYIPFIWTCYTNYLLYFLTFSDCNLHLRRWHVNLHLHWYSNFPKQPFTSQTTVLEFPKFIFFELSYHNFPKVISTGLVYQIVEG